MKNNTEIKDDNQAEQPTVSGHVEPVVSLPIKAIWTLELNTVCPNCSEHIDLLEDGDFWEDSRVAVCEHDTERSKNIDAWCEHCEHEFKVDLAY